MDGYLAFCINGDFDDIYNRTGIVSKPESLAVLNVMSRNEPSLIFDMRLISGSVNSLILYRDVFPAVIAALKDIRIIFANGIRMDIEAGLFEVMAKTTNNLYFSVERVTSVNQLNNLNGLKQGSAYSFMDYDGSVAAFNVSVRYNDAIGNPLSVYGGITVTLPLPVAGVDGKYYLASAVVSSLIGRTR